MIADTSEQQAEATTGRRERRDAQENRRHILAVAKHLFDTQGVANTSMHEIGQAAGVGQGTLYRHFANKGDLCHALIRDDIDAFEQRVGELIADTRLTPLARLALLLAEKIQITESHLPLFPAMEESHREVRQGKPPRGPFDSWVRERTVELLEEGIAQGEVVPLDTAITADAIVAAVSPRLYSYQRQECGYSIKRIIAGLQQLFVTGLRRQVVGQAG